MDSNSLFEELEPRHRRPSPALLSNFRYSPEVSEPSLFRQGNYEGFSPAAINEISPAKASQCACCTCKSNLLSPQVIDNSFKELISEQNAELRKLRHQVEKLLNYQDRLQQRTNLYLENKETYDECTQTSVGDISPYRDMLKPVPGSTPSPSSQRCGKKNVQQSRVTQDRTEITLTFRDLHLETIVEQPSSPQPTVCVSLQEYPDSSEHSAEISVSNSCANVMDQIQKLLNDAKQLEVPAKTMEGPPEQISEIKLKTDGETRQLTMKRLRELGISFVDTLGKRNGCSSIFVPHVEEPSDLWDQCHKSSVGNDQSLEMRMLEQKYLGRQLQVTMTEQMGTAAFSLCTQRYLQRYGLVEETTKQKHMTKSRQPSNPDRFLDSVLFRDQPKLL